ncbi:cytochrome c biogenesis CcdA family protein [Pseudomonas sp. TCU-HL1]|uniref:cytochrome c biogenesis CcdA family protein n=1 Tax=Pseudomonas sp. TCU-HL1 TaxID=1856685 RepID=UPI00083E16B9|nr:cytochrome c biogenesis protein CcdA [Pseudomonas sp. TCU-HL1]AOE85931.1 cytochrome C biogenesis protein [Pseudomonas sp. TCU-HL1]
MVDLSPDALRLAVEAMGYGAVGVGFLAGIVFSTNPVAVAAIPVALAYVAHARAPHEATRLGGLFVLGMLVTHVLLGLIAGLGGRWVGDLMGRAWGLMLGPLLIALGFVWVGWLRLPLPALALRAKRPTGGWGAFALGVPFSLAVCPICTPALLSLLGVVAMVGSPWLGAVVLLAFALGRAVPILLGAWAIHWLEALRTLGPFRRAFDVAAGLTLIATGLYLLNAYYLVIPTLAS